MPLASRLLERGHRVGEQLFDSSPLLHLRVVLCLEIGETFGQRGQLGGVFLICILASRLGGRQLPLQLGAHRRLSIEPFLERDLPFGRCGHVGVPLAACLVESRNRFGELLFDRRSLPDFRVVLSLEIGMACRERRELRCVL